jgi:hypothetical protein
MGRAALFLVTILAGCSGGRAPSDRPARASSADSNDTAFALVQARGHQAMGVDQYTSTHRFESLPDGGRISLQRDPDDSAGAARIRRHMQTIASAFAQGNFQLPGFVHDREVPGTAVMAQRRSRITYQAESLADGGQLRIRSQDPTAVAAIHQFLSFQRQDHRSGAGAAGH